MVAFWTFSYLRCTKPVAGRKSYASLKSVTLTGSLSGMILERIEAKGKNSARGPLDRQGF